MKLKEQLKAKQAELLALKDAIENGDQEAIVKAGELADEIKQLQEAIAAAEKATSVLNSLGTPAEDEGAEGAAKGVKVSGIKSLQNQAKSVDRNRKGWSISTHFKSGDETATLAPQLVDVDKNVDVKPAHKIADHFGQLRITGNAVTYFPEIWKTEEGGFGLVEQNSKKNKVLIDSTPVTESLVKIAGYTKETDELLEDAEFLASAVDDTLRYRLVKAENDYVVGSISAKADPNEYTLAYPAAEAQGDVEKETANIIAMMDAILDAKMAIGQDTPYTADAVIMNPLDYSKVMRAKDKNGQYYGGGWFSGAYGNGSYSAQYSPWGLTLLTSSEVVAGNPIVVAGKEAVKIYRKNDIAVKLYDQNEDDAIYNRVTIVAEERLLAVLKAASAARKLTPKDPS